MISMSPAEAYYLWLDKIRTTHIARAWESENAAVEEQDEEFAVLWEKLDERRQGRLWGLSSDLNTLRDNETFVEDDWEPMTQAQLAREQSQAYEGKDWDRLLEALRRPPKFLPRAQVDYLRGRAWMEMENPEIAVLFFDNAARLDPKNASYPILALECLTKVPDWVQALQRAQQLAGDKTARARLLFRAADVFYRYGSEKGDAKYFEQAIAAVDDGLVRLKNEGPESLQSVVAAAYGTKGFSLQHLDRLRDAAAVFEEAVQKFPDDSALVTARGIVRRQLGEDSIEDFRTAMRHNSPLVWPYLELARDSVRRREFAEAAEMCRLGIARSRDTVVTAHLRDLIAIALFHLGRPADDVRAAFEIASSLNPISEEIRAHRQAFEDHVRSPGTPVPDWQITFDSSMNAIDDIDAQLRLAA